MAVNLQLGDIKNEKLKELLELYIENIKNFDFTEGNETLTSDLTEDEELLEASEHNLVLYLNRLFPPVKKKYSGSSRKGCRTTSIEEKCSWYDYGKRRCVLRHTKDNCSLLKRNQKD